MPKRKADKLALQKASKRLKKKSSSSLDTYNGLSVVVEGSTPETFVPETDDEIESSAPRMADTPTAENWTKLEYSQKDSTITFQELVDSGEFSLNQAVLAGLKRKKFVCPTPVQRAAIPLALAGTDCLFKAPTGTGKTLAYGLPLLSMICDAAEASSAAESRGGAESRGSVSSSSSPSRAWRNQVKGIILVPSKELVAQVADVMTSLCFHILDLVSIWAMPESISGNIREFRLGNQNSNILVTQPGALIRICQQILTLEKKSLSSEMVLFFPQVRHLVIDEADLILGTFGFHHETSELFRPTLSDWNGRSVCIIPTGQSTGTRCQIILSSATLNEELSKLKKLALYKPNILCVTNSDESDKDPMLLDSEITSLNHLKVDSNIDGSRAPIRHFIQRIDRRSQSDFLSLFCLLKFKWCPLKTLIFTNSIEQAYKIFLFLQSFGFKVGIATPSQTLSIRLRNIKKFNQSLFSILVACDSVFNQGEDPILTTTQENDTNNNIKTNNIKTNTKTKTNTKINSSSSSSVDTTTTIIPPFSSIDEECISDDENDKKRKKNKKNNKEDKMSSMSRGLDFRGVESILNFDCSIDSNQYIHRCGRAVRDFKRSGLVGTSISLVGMDEELILDPSIQIQEIKPEDTLSFNGYRYRVQDVCLKLTAKTIRNFQLQEATEEIEIKDEHLSLADQTLLKLAKSSHSTTKNLVSPSLKKLPKYLTNHSTKNPLLK